MGTETTQITRVPASWLKAHRRQGTTSDIFHCRLGPPSAVAPKKRGSGRDPSFARVRKSPLVFLVASFRNRVEPPNGSFTFTLNSRHLGGLCNAFGPLVRGVRASRREARRARGASAFDVKVGCGANIFITPTLTQGASFWKQFPFKRPRFTSELH